MRFAALHSGCNLSFVLNDTIFNRRVKSVLPTIIFYLKTVEVVILYIWVPIGLSLQKSFQVNVILEINTELQYKFGKRVYGLHNTNAQINTFNIFIKRIIRWTRSKPNSSLCEQIGIKHDFSCINIRQLPREVLKTEVGGRGFQHLPKDLVNVNELKNHVRSLLLHKN